ncbi:hypothetical protein NEHOM01_2398 [Nematocida homosporus]|uniref:uncharacterized protein n=1 Tax=Nematocida homosporus TaxID=1912981 RepID=UPI00221FB1CB|nr:uncharacterized protein NEHOM01_2398 [Nematocida homosporus]KAI5187834.1 hypothetical protein NEHOM01_2398 [Nematocida homosporus]
MLGVGLAWLLGWSSDITSGQMTGADDDNNTKINWKDHCVKSDNGWQITGVAIDYDANPECSEMKFKEGDVLEVEEPSDYYVTKWKVLLKLGLLSDYDTKRIATMMNNCRRIHSLDAKTCPNDLEKDSLLYAIESAIYDIEKGQTACQGYIEMLEKLTKSAAGKDALPSLGSLDSSKYEGLHKEVRDLIQTYSPFYIFYLPVVILGLANDSNKHTFEAWKTLINNSTVSNIDLCGQKQLRHVLYDTLRMQVMLSNLSNLSNTPLSAYPNITISNDDQKHIDDILNLNIADLIKNMPADEAAEKVREKLSHSIGLQVKYDSFFKQPDYIKRLTGEFERAYGNNMDQVPIETIKQHINDLKEVSKWFKPLLDKTKKLQAQFNAQLTNTTTASSIHECVEYLTTNATIVTDDTTTTDTDTLADDTHTTSPTTPHNTMSSSASSLKSSWMPNSPILHILISSLFWARLAHLLELSH